MMNAFFVENYKNIKIKQDLHLNAGISFIYGACGSGKTSLCLALADVCMHERVLDVKNKTGVTFKYGFKVLDKQVWYQYTRDQERKPYDIQIVIPQLIFSYVCKGSLINTIEIWDVILNGNNEEDVKQVAFAIKQELLDTYFWIPEVFMLKRAEGRS